MNKLRQFINESRKIHGLDEKLSSSDKKEIKNTTGLTDDEKKDFIIVYDLMLEIEKFQKVIDNVSKKIKTEEAKNQIESIAAENNRETIWQMSDYISEMVERINMGLKESFVFLEESEMNEKELSPLQKEYREYFKETLAEYDVDSPAKLEPAKKLEFFNSIKSGWEVGKGKKTN